MHNENTSQTSKQCANLDEKFDSKVNPVYMNKRSRRIRTCDLHITGPTH